MTHRLHAHARRCAVGLALALSSLGCGRRSAPDLENVVAPAVPSFLLDGEGPVRTFDALDVLDWARAQEPIVVVKNRQDELPNGLAAKAAPLFVNWSRSEPGDAYLVRNVNVACDPVRGTTTLATVRVPKDGIASAEFVLVRDRRYGKELPIGHGMLRFVFEPGKQPEVVVPEGTIWHGDRFLDDLVISYEAWRPPGEAFDVIAGLAPDRYALTVRCYNGAAYFVQTAVKQFQWECYPLSLAGLQEGDRELFRICLLMGDGLGRRVLADALDDGTLTIPNANEFREWTEADEAQASELFRRDRVPDDPVESIVGEGEISYHTLQRSCLSLAILSIDLAQARMVERLGVGRYTPLAVSPSEVPGWVTSLPGASRTRMLALLPAATVWLAQNQDVIPPNAWRILRDGRVLRVVDGSVVKYVYRAEGATPWGRLTDNL